MDSFPSTTTTSRSAEEAARDEQPAEQERRNLRRVSPLFQTVAVVRECPLHIAMRHVAEAAVTQHVLYVEGEYAPRADLNERIEHWFRVHQLVRDYICPATRTVSPTPRDLDVALATLPEESRARLTAMLRVCGRRSAGDGCPLDEDPESFG
ncbi:MAG TPA: hypothetical protein VFU88_12920 [Ktedonobacterales bacterium]|nr:hypothetical protein [Ktedonobacterales bacterium]